MAARPPHPQPSDVIIDMPAAVAQVEDEEFVFELLTDFVKDEDKKIPEMRESIANNEHKTFTEAAHFLKGPALNLALKALSWATYDAEMVGRALQKAEQEGLREVMVASTNKVEPVTDLLVRRTKCVDLIEKEFARLQQYVEGRQA